jgi:4-hydroxy-tetrahydrodipicolinate reductase
VRVGVVGAVGRMGSETCRAIVASDDLDLVAAVSPAHAGSVLGEVADVESDITVAGDLAALSDAGCDVAVEFTGPGTVGDNLIGILERDIHAVVGATGFSDESLARAAAIAASGSANALVAPNFAIGAVLLMGFAEQAARHLPHVEIIELHHDAKADAPSGTALRTADLISGARPYVPDAPAEDPQNPGARGTIHGDVRIHSVRLPGLVAHQEVVFGGEGQTLTLRHDSIHRGSFMPGVLLACREVAGLDGLVVGLEHLL